MDYYAEESKNLFEASKRLNEQMTVTRNAFTQKGDIVELMNANIQSYVDHLIEGKDKNQLEKKTCSKVLKDVLCYDFFEFNERYIGYESKLKDSYYVSSYSGKVDSSGNVSLSPNYSKGSSYMTEEKTSKVIYDKLIIKSVKSGEGYTVRQLEDEFFSADGDTYINLKLGNAYLPGKMWKMQRLFAILNFIFLTVIFGVLNYVVNTVAFVGEDINVLFAVPTMLMIIFYIIFGICLSRCRRDVKKYYNVESKTSKNFLILLIVFYISSIGLFLSAYSPEFEYSGSDIILLSIVLEVITILISLIFLAVSARLSGKNPYANLYKELIDLKKDSAKVAMLEKLASEIRSYTVS